MNNMSNMQAAGRKGRSTLDNIFIYVAIMEKHRIERKKAYVFFADAVKCFDKLWMKDGLLELNKNGMSEFDVSMIYILNETADIIIKTPCGITENITVKNIVKQGTTLGPIICCTSTDKVNNINEKVVVKYGNIVEIGMPIYMDDNR